MQAAAEYRPGLSYAYDGQGETAFVTAIDGLRIAGADGGNWVYTINGEKATRSAGIQTVQPGDAVLWHYSMPE